MTSRKLLLKLLQQLLPSLPGLIARLLIGRLCIGGFSPTHKTMPRVIVSNGLVRLSRLFHDLGGLGNSAGYPGIVATIKPVDGTLNASDFCLIGWARAVEYKRGF